jgi:hypothetical protein
LWGQSVILKAVWGVTLLIPMVEDNKQQFSF